MPRAHRHYLPGHIWHITHRCHNKAFLLEGEYERYLWLSWLQKAKNRYKLIILNYTVTCNHIHLLLEDPGNDLAIARGMQLIQGQTAQACNRYTGRSNAFWGDRYHATAVESGIHLLSCLVYIDLNMVRTGAVNCPEEWHDCGYNEIQNERARDGIIDKRRLAMLLGCPDLDSLSWRYKLAVADAMRGDALKRDDRWTESIAVGSRGFVDAFAANLGERIRGRTVICPDTIKDSFMVREQPAGSYGEKDETAALRGDNSVPCEIDF